MLCFQVSVRERVRMFGFLEEFRDDWNSPCSEMGGGGSGRRKTCIFTLSATMNLKGSEKLMRYKKESGRLDILCDPWHFYSEGILMGLAVKYVEKKQSNPIPEWAVILQGL